MFSGPVAAPQVVRRSVAVPRRPKGLVPGFQYYLSSTIADAVHSGNGRTAAEDSNTDYYLVPLSEDSLRPGTIYADPYGHVLILVKRLPQTGEGAGLFLAVDGQPDGTVARKRFWRGNFLFAQDPALGSPGFKRFRPIVREKNGKLRRLSNDEIANNADYGDYSPEQSTLQVEEFYDRMDDVMSPAPLDPMRALKEAITALEEQVKTRVKSVDNGRQYLAGGGKNVDMPDGASIFETTGAWEDFATPSRDLRLLIAIDVVRGFPDRVARRPERYAMPQGKSAEEVKAELEATLAAELAARKFSYTRTDDSQWTLTLKDVLDRLADLEMAYNINDCAEARWGAPQESEEAATCKRRASDGAAEEDDRIPRLVQRAPPPAARLRRAVERAPKLLHRDGEAAEVGVRHQPDLPALELQHSALLIGEHDGACAAAEGQPRARRAIDAGHVGGAADILHPAAQHGLRSAEHETIVDAADRERINSAAEGEGAVAPRSADNPAGFVDRQNDPAAVCARMLNPDRQQGDERNDNDSEYRWNSHGFPSIVQSVRR